MKDVDAVEKVLRERKDLMKTLAATDLFGSPIVVQKKTVIQSTFDAYHDGRRDQSRADAAIIGSLRAQLDAAERRLLARSNRDESTELAALRIECNGLRMRISKVTQALTTPI